MEQPSNDNNEKKNVVGEVLTSLFPDTQFLADTILKHRDFFERIGWIPERVTRPSDNALFDLLGKMGEIDEFEHSRELTEEDNDTLVNTIWPEIWKTLEDAGYEFHYFAFFKSDDPAVRIFWDKVKPTPENFEGGTTLYTQEIYQKVLDTIKDHRFASPHRIYRGGGPGYNLSGIHTGNGIQITGWRKEDLLDAIRATGLHKPVTKTVNGVTVRRAPLNDLLGNPGDRMPGLISPSMPRVYYEAIYRKIFNTLITIDWAKVCSKRLVTFRNLRNVVVRDFYFNYKQILKLNYEGLCNLLVQESERRRALREGLKKGIPMTQPMITMQPGALAVQLQVQTLGEFAPTFGPQRPFKPVYME